MLQERLRQRDSEIRILLRMMKQERKRADRAEASLGAAGGRVLPVSPVSPDRLSPMRLAARSVEGSVAPTTTPVSVTRSSSLRIEGSCGSDQVSVSAAGGGEGISLRGAKVAGGGGGDGDGGSGLGIGGVSTSVSTSSGDGEWKAALKSGA